MPVPRPVRREPPELVELRRLREARPDLAEAVDLEIALYLLQRRIQTRVPLPWLAVTDDWLRREQAAGRPLLQFSDIPLEPSDLRLGLRETAALLRRFGLLDPAEHDRVQQIVREDGDLRAHVARWFAAAGGPGVQEERDALPAALVQLAMRPFLARCAEALMPRLDPEVPGTGRCPICHGGPEMAILGPSGRRLLVCARCTGRWTFDATACPFCDARGPGVVSAFTSRDGPYLVYGCNRCRRYLKAVDARARDRTALLAADIVATLPLDAAAIQKGYSSG